MTANKHFKRRVRERARRTGESYTAALRVLRHSQGPERAQTQEKAMRELPITEGTRWERHDVPEFGYSISLPAGWQRRAPDLRNSPAETARFVDPSDRQHSVIVFRHPVRPGRTPLDVAAGAQSALEAAHYGDFRITPVMVGQRAGARLDCSRVDAARVWAVTEFFVVLDEEAAALCLGCSSVVPDHDDELFTAIAERFTPVPAVGTDPDLGRGLDLGDGKSGSGLPSS